MVLWDAIYKSFSSDISSGKVMISSNIIVFSPDMSDINVIT